MADEHQLTPADALGIILGFSEAEGMLGEVNWSRAIALAVEASKDDAPTREAVLEAIEVLLGIDSCNVAEALELLTTRMQVKVFGTGVIIGQPGARKLLGFLSGEPEDEMVRAVLRALHSVAQD